MCAKKTGSIEDLAVVGVDIGKDTFHLVGFDRSGQVVLRKQIKRLALTRRSRRCRDAWSGWRPASAPTSSAEGCATVCRQGSWDI